MNFILTRTVVISWTTPSFVSHPSVSILAEPCRITFLNIILYCNVQLNKCYFHRKTFENFYNFISSGGNARELIFTKFHFVTCIWFTFGPDRPANKMKYLGLFIGSWIPELRLEILGARVQKMDFLKWLIS